MRALVLAVALASASLVLASASSGRSLYDCTSSHCYGETDAQTSLNISGEIAVINTHSLSSGSPCSGWATSEQWLLTGSGFIENGILAGEHVDKTCGSGDQFFWGEFSSNLPNLYAQHFPGGSVGLNTNYTYKILFLSGLSWEVDRNGSVLGYANSSSCCGGTMDAGSESNINSFTSSGEASGLQKQVYPSTWSYGWTGATAVVKPSGSGVFTMSGTPSSDESWSH